MPLPRDSTAMGLTAYLVSEGCELRGYQKEALKRLST